MIKQLIINGKKSYDDFDLYISERTISQPKKKSIKESVPFSNVVYDFSDINGEIYWEERTLKYVFDFAELSTEEMEKAKSKVLTWLMNVHDTDIYDPYIGDYHFRGSFESDSWSEDFGAGTLTINFSVYPYKISNSDTSIIEEIGDELTGSSPLTINNSASDDLESLTIYGNSEQETRSGKNKLNILPFENFSSNGVTTSFDGETFTITGTSTTSWYNLIKEQASDIPVGRYLFSYVEATQSRIVLSLTFEDGTNKGYWLTSKSMVVDITQAVTKINIFTDGQTSGVEINKIIKGLMLEPMETGSTPTEFEKYGAMPSSDFPSEVKVIKGVKNLFKCTSPLKTSTISGITTTIDDDGLITLNGTATNDMWPDVLWGIQLNTVNHDECKYYFDKTINNAVMSIKVVGGTASIEPTFTIATNDDTTEQKSVEIATGNNIKFTKPIYGLNRAYIYIPKGAIFDNFQFYVQLEEGSIAHSYVPYGSKYLRVDIFSGNYLDKITNYGWNKNDATFEVIDDYLKIIMPLSPKRWSGVYCKNYGDDGLAMVNLLARLKGKRCTYSFYARADKERTIYFQFGDTEVTYINLTTEWKRYSRTMVIGSQVPTFYCGETYDDTTYYIKDIMLEDGDTLSNYRENGEDYILIDMAIYDEEGNITGYRELCDINGTKDELFLDKSTNKITQRIGKFILDGSENWSINNGGTDNWYYLCNISSKILTANLHNANVELDRKAIALSNLYLNGDVGNANTNKGMALFSNGTTTTNIRIREEVEGTIEEFKTRLAKQNLIGYGILATPVEINNEPITLPKTFDDGTIITINDELEVTMNVTYNEKKTLIIDNISSHRVTPTIRVEGNLTIELNNTSYGLSTGTYNNGLYLESGINEVILRGTGKIKFSYVEEVL